MAKEDIKEKRQIKKHSEEIFSSEIKTDGVAIVQLRYLKRKAMIKATEYSDKVRKSDAIISWMKSFSIGIGIGIVFFTILFTCHVW